MTSANNLSSIPVQTAPELLQPGSVPTPEYTPAERLQLRQRIMELLKQRDAVLVAHY